MKTLLTNSFYYFTFFLLTTSLAMADSSVYSKCGIYDVSGTVKLKNGNVFLDFKKGPEKKVSLKVLNAPLSLKLLENFSVNLKLDVQKITGRQPEAKYVKGDEEIKVFPGDTLSEVTLEKEGECTSSKTASKNLRMPAELEPSREIRSATKATESIQ